MPCLILPWHKDIDAAREQAAGDAQIGTTRRGIGPAYEDKVGRRAIRVADLADPAALDLKLDRLLAHHGRCALGLSLPEPDGAQLKKELLAIAPKILAYAQPAWERLDQAVRLGRRILFEGAQGVMLDVDHGTYPFVTSSNVVSGQAAAGAGVGPGAVTYVLGLVKAYTTRVGGGPFPTEQDNEIGQAPRHGGPRVRHQHRTRAPLRLVRCRDGAPGVRGLGRQRPRADQARRARRVRRDQGLHALQARTTRPSTASRPA